MAVKRLGKLTAIQPDSFWSPSMAKLHDAQSQADQVITAEGREERFRTPPHQPDLALRLQGFTRNPAVCAHEHTRMSDATFRWRCADCGEWL